MEFIFGIFEGADCCLAGFDLVIALLDAFVFTKSKPNRRKRGAAKRQGAKPPPRDPWSWATIVLTILVVILTALIVGGCILQNLRGMG